jgi:predicted ATPase/5-methylcytosine-specific restriction endonuclease McrA
MRFIEREPLVESDSERDLQLRSRLRQVVDAAERNELIRSELYEIAREVDVASRLRLMEQFQGKCAYCERPLVMTDGVIDRFRPMFGAQRDREQIDQLHYCWLAAEWDNLYLCCNECNTYKSNRFPVAGTSRFGRSIAQLRGEEGARLIDPCWDRPQNEFEIAHGGVLRANTMRGTATITILNLNRRALCDSRWHVLLQFHHLWSYSIELALRMPDDSVHVELRSMLDHSAEHVGILYLYLHQHAAMPERRLLNRIISSGIRDAMFLPLLRGIGALPPLSELGKASGQPAARDDFASELGEYRPVRSLRIRNFKGIDELEINFPLTSALDGNALAIVGQNSAGKSSVLQALALALIGPTAACEVVSNASALLTHGATNGEVMVEFWGTDARNCLNLHKNSRLFGGFADRPTRVFGYGPYRLLAKRPLSKSKRDTRFRLQSLFRDGERLNGFHQWIDRLTDTQRRDLAESLQLLLASPNTRVSVGGHTIYIRTNDKLHPITALSSGMQSMVSICTDFAEPLYAGSESALQGSSVILVDELDAHLHPAWRIGIVGRLNRAFPHAHLIFSTHDPLTLRGLSAEQIQILYRDRQGSVRAKRADWYSDSLDVDQILTSDIFGMQDTHLPEWEGKFHEYHALLAKDDSGQSMTAEESARLEMLDAELRDVGLVGRTKRERLVYGVIDRLLAQGTEALTEWDPVAMDRLSEIVQAKIDENNNAENAT